MSIAGTTIAFLAALASPVVNGRNKPLTNKDIEDSREIARLKAAVKLERERADANAAQLITQTSAFGRLMADNANLIHQRDEARIIASQAIASNRNPLLPEQSQMLQPMQSAGILYAQGLAAVTSDQGHGHGSVHPADQTLLEWCNCVPARHDLLRPR